MEEQEKEEEKALNMRKDILGMLVYMGIICLIVYIVLHFVGQRIFVSGDSMEDTLYHGESLLMDKLSYRFSDPERYDIVVFPGPSYYGENPYYIKRIIGLPGESLQIIDGRVYIDGKLLDTEHYGITDRTEEAGIASEEILLGPEEYFCMGDNRPVSLDSRDERLGPVKREDIVGKVWIRILPLSKAGNVDEKH